MVSTYVLSKPTLSDFGKVFGIGYVVVYECLCFTKSDG